MSKELSKLRSKADEKRTDFVHYSMQLSEQIDEINSKENQIRHM